MSATRHNAERRTTPRGFTLTELMVVFAIIGAMAAMSVPSFQRAIEQSRCDIAAANLRTIWAAERLYWLEYQTYTSDLTILQSLKLLDPTINSTDAGGYNYSATVVSSSSVTAAATRSGSSQWSGSLSISGDGEISGVLSAPGNISIMPGYQ
jgi:type IV pilus assembly protein PilA